MRVGVPYVFFTFLDSVEHISAGAFFAANCDVAGGGVSRHFVKRSFDLAGRKLVAGRNRFARGHAFRAHDSNGDVEQNLLRISRFHNI